MRDKIEKALEEICDEMTKFQDWGDNYNEGIAEGLNRAIAIIQSILEEDADE